MIERAELPAMPHGPHVDAERHHHHSHAARSRHPGNHHLLTVEDLTVSFSMYDESRPYFRAERVMREQLHHLSLSVHEGEVVEDLLAWLLQLQKGNDHEA